MNGKDLPLFVGKRGRDDSKEIELNGSLWTPNARSDTLIIFQAGIDGHYKDYEPFFAQLLANNFNVYVAEMRRRGLARTPTLVNDLVQVDEQVRDRVETDKVIYIAHSMGMNIAVGASNEQGIDVERIYGICAFPSYGDLFNRSPDPNTILPIQSPVNWFGKTTSFGPTSHQLRDQQTDKPMRFAIGGLDEVVYTFYKGVARRFQNMFKQTFPQSSSKVFEGKNHCFNHKRWDFAPFNKDKPEDLIDDITAFVYEG